MTNKCWCIGFLAIVLVLLVGIGGLTAFVDPFFHYHAPLDMLRYQIYDQRHQNDGIVKHFDYDAIITGTSVTENFKTSELDTLFGTHAIKVCYAGGSFKEINDNLVRALKANEGIRCIVRSLDAYKIVADKDEMEADFRYPTYLYDDHLLNDVSYLLNKTVFLQNTLIMPRHTMLGFDTTSFDDYSNWMSMASFGRDMLPKAEDRPQKAAEQLMLTQDERRMAEENLRQNVISLLEAYPDVQFYYFFPPYSMYWWDSLDREGTLKKQLDILRETTQMLVGYENLHLFSFYDDHALIENCDLYKDTVHYHESVNSQMLEWMVKEEHRLTEENCDAYWDALEAYLMEYPFDSLYEE